MGRSYREKGLLPGMPDAVAKQPSKAATRPPARTLDEAISRAHDLVAEALDRYPIVARSILFSGGNDSAVLLHLMQSYLDSSANDAVLHVDTGIGVPDTHEHVRDVVRAWNLPYKELRPRDKYEDLVLGRVLATRGPNTGKRSVWIGMPGPGGDSHKVMYRRLKDQPLMEHRARIIGDRGRHEKILYLAGMRWDESDSRMRNASEIDPEGSVIWVSPIVHFTNDQMREYQDRFLLPKNPVAEHLHMSAECLCGCFAKPGELDQIEFFYPKTAYTIRSIEKKVADAGIPACKWGTRPPGSSQSGTGKAAAGRLCKGCAPPPFGQTDLMDEWIAQGLLSPPVPAEANACPTPAASRPAGAP